MAEVTFRFAKIEDSDKILDFLRLHFFPEEPVTIGIEPKEPSAEDEQCIIANINDGCTIIAEYKAMLIGVLIAGPITSNYVNSLRIKSNESSDYKWKQIATLLAEIQANSNIFVHYNIETSLHIHTLAVDVQYRRMSIGKQLMEQLFTLGASLKYSIISADCTGYYSIKLAEKLDMKLVSTMKYNDYKDENGSVIFKVPHPHSEIKTFVKKL